MSTLTEIAQQINECNDNIILIYALNSTGKTRLSVEYKNFTKKLNDGNHAGVYFNAYSEDLFNWDNDEENDNVDLKLNVIPSSLNEFHSFLVENVEQIKEKLAPFNPKYDFELETFENQEDGIQSITFLKMKRIKYPLKFQEVKNGFSFGASF